MFDITQALAMLKHKIFLTESIKDELIEAIPETVLKDYLSALQNYVVTIEAPSFGNPDRTGLLNNLGSHLSQRHRKSGAMADLEEAIQSLQRAVNKIPSENPDLARWLNNLRLRLSDRYKRIGAMSDLE